MTESDLNILLSELRAEPEETEWLEFKENNGQELGEYISALSNAACLHNKDYAYLVFGINDNNHRIVGTNFNLNQKI
ncbi:MAG TPA: transcriptional regulator, partial [Maribacter sp.]|nr:transcriptional regulator [Maribacter sp.]